MRHLPPLPDNFFRLVLEWRANAAKMTTGFNIFAPGATGATSTQMTSFISDWFVNALPHLLAVCPSDATVAACRLTATGPSPLTVVEQLAPNAGAFGSTAIANGALCLTWRTSDRGIGARSHTLLPLTADLVQADRAQLRQDYWQQAASHATTYLQAVNALVSPDGGLCVAAVVHRSRNGTPLPASTWSPVELGDASPHIGTCARRVPDSRSPSPF